MASGDDDPVLVRAVSLIFRKSYTGKQNGLLEKSKQVYVSHFVMKFLFS